ncbi:MAG: hypothetical protein ACJARD_000664 [Alphaproteobacteria bacterium]|jgi:hypothetical protein
MKSVILKICIIVTIGAFLSACACKNNTHSTEQRTFGSNTHHHGASTTSPLLIYNQKFAPLLKKTPERTFGSNTHHHGVVE